MGCSWDPYLYFCSSKETKPWSRIILSRTLVEQTEAFSCSKTEGLGTWRLWCLLTDKPFSGCWNELYKEKRRQEAKRKGGGKICNALFKAKQTYPDMPALRFWKPGWKEWGKPQCGCQEPFEGWRRPWIAKRMFREEDNVGNSTVASDAFIACCIEVIEHFSSLVIPYLQLTFISRFQGWELAKAVTLPSPPTRCLTHECLTHYDPERQVLCSGNEVLMKASGLSWGWKLLSCIALCCITSISLPEFCCQGPCNDGDYFCFILFPTD